MIRRPPRSTQSRSSAASDVYKRQIIRLHKSLAKKFPAARSRTVAAGVKVGMLISAVANGPKNIGIFPERTNELKTCLLYTSDAADDLLCVDLGGRRIIKKKKKIQKPQNI